MHQSWALRYDARRVSCGVEMRRWCRIPCRCYVCGLPVGGAKADCPQRRAVGRFRTPSESPFYCLLLRIICINHLLCLYCVVLWNGVLPLLRPPVTGSQNSLVETTEGPDPTINATTIDFTSQFTSLRAFGPDDPSIVTPC
mgnify:CR=1 FL=1